MFSKININQELSKLKDKRRTVADGLLQEAKQILNDDLFKHKKILDNLTLYNDTFKKLNDNEVDQDYLYTLNEIKELAIIYRLRFLESQHFKAEFPYEAILKIKDLNSKFGKELEGFKVLAPLEAFGKNTKNECCVMFAPTLNGNYYLIHQWGNLFKKDRKYRNWPLRSFETLFITLLVLTLIITLCLPSGLIALNVKNVPYWSGYRIATFFHLLIFNFGVTAYYTFTFSKNFSSSIWDSDRNF